MSQNTPELEAQKRAQARRRANLILKVHSGLMTASAAAKALGASRKTYYKWEKRALEGMLEGLCERSSGRPASDRDEEKEQLQTKVQELEQRLQDQSQNMQRRQHAQMAKSEAEKKDRESSDDGSAHRRSSES
jgi:transposase